MNKKNLWTGYTDKEKKEIEQLGSEYKKFLNSGHTEREVVEITMEILEKNGFKNIEKINVNILKAQDIVNELNITLNMDYEVSENLRQLYSFVNERLIEANLRKDKKPLLEAKEIVTELRDTWKEAMALSRKGK